MDKASRLIRDIGTSHAVSVSGAILYAMRRLKWSHNRSKDVWYGNARLIKSEEMDQLRQVHEQVEREKAIQAVVALRGCLAKGDSEQRRAMFDDLNHALRSLGAEICPVDVPKGGKE